MQKVLTEQIYVENKGKRVLRFLIVLLLALATGITVGMYIVDNFFSGIDYSNYSEAGLRDNEANIYAVNKSKKVTDMNAINAYIVAENKLKDISSVTLSANGNIDAMGVYQTTYTKRYKNNNSYFVENISKGQVIAGIDTNIAERNYYETNGNVRVYKGTNIKESSATFDKLKEEVSLTKWKERNGTTPITFQPYIVSTKTVTSSSSPKACTLENGRQGYVSKISLNASGAYLYVKQIKNMSGLGDYPNFNFITLEVYFNEDATFNKIVVNEEYKVSKMGIPVKTVSKMNYHFSYEATAIPTI